MNLLKKGLIFKVLTAIDMQLDKTSLTHREVSLAINNSPPWFNNIFNNGEDIRMTSLIRIIAFITEQEEIDRKRLLDEIFSTTLMDYARLINVIKDEILPDVPFLEQKRLLEIIQEENRLLKDLDSQWAYLEIKNKLHPEEVLIRGQLNRLIFEGEESHGN